MEKRHHGQSVMEYALLVGVVMLIVVLALFLLQSGLSESLASLNVPTASPNAG